MAEWRDMPAEALIDGPPVDGELLLRRTLRQVRAERASLSPGTDGARMSVVLQPAAGQVRVSARIIGGPGGRLCRLVAVNRSGERRAVGDRFLAADGTTIERVTDAADLVTIELTDAAGTVLASAPLPTPAR